MEADAVVAAAPAEVGDGRARAHAPKEVIRPLVFAKLDGTPAKRRGDGADDVEDGSGRRLDHVVAVDECGAGHRHITSWTLTHRIWASQDSFEVEKSLRAAAIASKTERESAGL